MLQGEPDDIRRCQSRRLVETTLHRKIHRKFDRKISADAEWHVRHQGPSSDARAFPQKTRNHRTFAAERTSCKQDLNLNGFINFFDEISQINILIFKDGIVKNKSVSQQREINFWRFKIIEMKTIWKKVWTLSWWIENHFQNMQWSE